MTAVDSKFFTCVLKSGGTVPLNPKSWGTGTPDNCGHHTLRSMTTHVHSLAMFLLLLLLTSQLLHQFVSCVFFNISIDSVFTTLSGVGGGLGGPGQPIIRAWNFID